MQIQRLYWKQFSPLPRIFLVPLLPKSVQILTKYVKNFPVCTLRVSAWCLTPTSRCPRSCTLYQCVFECIMTNIEKCIARKGPSITVILDRKMSFLAIYCIFTVNCTKIPLFLPKMYTTECAFRPIKFLIRVTMHSNLHAYKVHDLGHRMMGVGHRYSGCSGLCAHHKIFDIFGQSSGGGRKKTLPLLYISMTI